MLDAAMIGGGPVGSYIAFELAKMGHKVAVLEKREKLGGSVCCTGIISLECVRSFNIPESLILRRLDSARIFSPSGDMLELSYPEPLACILDRAALDSYLAKTAEKAGAEIRLGSTVTSLKVSPDRVILNVEKDHQNLEIEARMAVLAPGAGSGLMKQAGLDSTPDTVMGAQCQVITPELDGVEIYSGAEFAPGFFAWLVPTFPGKSLAGLLTRQNAALYLGKFLDSLYSKKKITSKAALTFRPINLKAPPRIARERVIAVGGAAGQVKPITGGGIYLGLLSARIAAESVDKCLRSDDLSVKGLSSYGREWQAQLQREIKIGRYARSFYERLNDNQITELFRRLKPVIQSEITQVPDLSFDWHGKTLSGLLSRYLISEAVSKIGIPFKLNAI